MRRGTMTRGRAMLAAAWGVLVLAGCTATAEPEVEPTGEAVVQSTEPTPTSTPTPTPTVAPESIKPGRPDAMGQNDAEGAAAAASYFLSLFPYVFATGDLSDWQEFSHPECSFCTGIVEDVQAMATAGHLAQGGTFSLDASAARVITPNAWYAVELQAIQAPSVTVDRSGAVVEEFPGEKVVWIDAAVIHENGRWLIREFTPRDAQ